MSKNFYKNFYQHTYHQDWQNIAKKLELLPVVIIGFVETIKEVASQQLEDRGEFSYFKLGEIAMLTGLGLDISKNIFQSLIDYKFIQKISDNIYRIKNWKKYQGSFYNIQNSDKIQTNSDNTSDKNSETIFRFKSRKTAHNRYSYLVKKLENSGKMTELDKQDYALLSQYFSDKNSDTIQNSDNQNNFSENQSKNSDKKNTEMKPIKGKNNELGISNNELSIIKNNSNELQKETQNNLPTYSETTQASDTQELLGGLGSVEKKEKTSKKHPQSPEDNKDFMRLWGDYGKIGNRKSAYQAFLKINFKKISFEGILKKAIEYKQYKPFENYSHKHLSTWLNSEGWNDCLNSTQNPNQNQNAGLLAINQTNNFNSYGSKSNFNQYIDEERAATQRMRESQRYADAFRAEQQKFVEECF